MLVKCHKNVFSMLVLTGKKICEIKNDIGMFWNQAENLWYANSLQKITGALKSV